MWGKTTQRLHSGTGQRDNLPKSPKVPGGCDRDERRARRMPPGADGGGCPRPSPVPSRQAELRPGNDHRASRELGPGEASHQSDIEHVIPPIFALDEIVAEL